MSTVVMTPQQMEQELASIKRTLEDLQSAIDRISAALRAMQTPQAADVKPSRLVDYMGVGKEIWQQIDVDAYINAERESWS